jgi:hypothetical protein
MQLDLPNHGQPQDDPTGHVGPKIEPHSHKVNPTGHVGPKIEPHSHKVNPTGHVGPKIEPQDAPDGHVGPKITPNSPLNLNPISQGTSFSFTLTLANPNSNAQNWTWNASTPISSLMVNTTPGTLQGGAQETITATVNTSGLTQGNSYSPSLTFTFTPANASSTITIQFSVS